MLCALELYFATRRFELPIGAKVVMIALPDVGRKNLFAFGYLPALPAQFFSRGGGRIAASIDLHGAMHNAGVVAGERRSTTSRDAVLSAVILRSTTLIR